MPLFRFDGKLNVSVYEGEVGALQLGKFSSGTQGYGLKVTRIQTASLRIYSDDGGAVLWGTGSVPDVKGFISRFLLTKNNTGGHIRVHGLMGQLKAYDAYWNTEVVSAVHGRMELVRSAASMTLGGYGVSASVLGVVATSGAITVGATHILAGVAAISDFRATLTQTGQTVAFYAGKYDTTNWSDSTTRTTWGIGLYMKVGSATEAIRIGDKSSSIGSGIALNAANADDSGIAGLVRVFGDDGGVALPASLDINMIEGRYLVATDHSSHDASIKAIRGHLRVHTGKLPAAAQCAGIAGYIEIDGTSTIGTGINAAVSAMVDASGTVTGAANSVLSAFAAYSGGLTLGTARSTVLHIASAASFTSLFDINAAAGFVTGTPLSGGTAQYLTIYIANKAYTIALATAA